jgi:hypothetical protein
MWFSGLYCKTTNGVDPNEPDVHVLCCCAGLWGFGGCSTVMGSINAAFGHDVLHVEDLGITGYVVEGLVPYLTTRMGMTATAANAVLQQLDVRLALMPRWEEWAAPAHYFTSGSRITGKEHRCVMQALPHLLYGLLDDAYVELACL